MRFLLLEFKLATQPKSSTNPEGGDSKSSTTTHSNKMSPDGDSGVTNSGTLNEMPPDGYLLAKEPCAGGAPPDGAYLERLANKDQVNTTEDGVTLDCGRDKVASLHW